MGPGAAQIEIAQRRTVTSPVEQRAHSKELIERLSHEAQAADQPGLAAAVLKAQEAIRKANDDPDTIASARGELSEALVDFVATSTEPSGFSIVSSIFDKLVERDYSGALVPMLAESWKQTSPTAYVFNLRQGVKFTNGREMTVDDAIKELA